MTAPAYPFNGADRLLRINEVIQLLSISKSTWWEGVAHGSISSTCETWRPNHPLALASDCSIDRKRSGLSFSYVS